MKVSEYEQDVWRNIPTLHYRLVSHQYRAQPLRRVYVPKENGTDRPISIPALEDKIVQKATVTVFSKRFAKYGLTECVNCARSGL